MGFDPMYMLYVLPALLLGMYAKAKLSSSFKKYSKIRTQRGVTGSQVARTLLDSESLFDVTIERSKGTLTDHYDPRGRVLRLSEGVHDSPSIAAAGIAAHEMGHALQHAQSYSWLRLRSIMVPSVKFGSFLGPLMFIAGLVLNILDLAWIGVALFAATTAFTIVTLPVEYDASRRAKKLLAGNGIIVGNEIEGVNKVLDAAALTYVAAAVQSILTLFYYVSLLRGRRR